MRGNHVRLGAIRRNKRSIPARAGEPHGHSRCSGQSEVYPRACGGTIADLAQQDCQYGLSPRVRGNLEPGQGVVQVNGSIPARAGEPMAFSVLAYRHKVYPRACGGTEDVTDRMRYAAGLSPRVRGNQTLTTRIHVWIRSIPARAGEPLPERRFLIRHRVYPRACGGTRPFDAPVSFRGGLSPRVRGNRRPRALQGSQRGSIPARAGEPWPWPRSPAR